MRSIMSDRSSSDPLADVKAVCTAEKLIEMQKKAKAVFVDDSVYDYISDLCDATRHNENISLGVSPRGALALCRIAKAWACMFAATGYHFLQRAGSQDLRQKVCLTRYLAA